MRQDKFKKLMDGLDELTARQRKKVVETLSEKIVGSNRSCPATGKISRPVRKFQSSCL